MFIKSYIICLKNIFDRTLFRYKNHLCKQIYILTNVYRNNYTNAKSI